MNLTASTSLAAGYAALLRVNAVQLARSPVGQTGATNEAAPAVASISLTPGSSPGGGLASGRGSVIDMLV